MNKKGFTLIELLAVIIILGILMTVAVVGITRYINESRKDAYVATAKTYASSAVNFVNSAKVPMFDEAVTYYMPEKCVPMEKSSFITSNVSDMSFMFYYCVNIASINLSYFNTEKVTKITHMFMRCRSLSSLDIRSFNFDSVTDLYSYFVYDFQVDAKVYIKDQKAYDRLKAQYLGMVDLIIV